MKFYFIATPVQWRGGGEGVEWNSHTHGGGIKKFMLQYLAMVLKFPTKLLSISLSRSLSLSLYIYIYIYIYTQYIYM